MWWVSQPRTPHEANIEQGSVSALLPEMKSPNLYKNEKPTCYSLGPFENEVDLESISTKMLNLGVIAEHRKETAQVTLGYWVYLPSFPSWQDARKKVQELEEKGIKDLFIQGSGKMKNAISLGLFKSEEGANQRLAQMKEIGVKPIVETQYKAVERYWIDIGVESGKKQVISSIEAISKGLTTVDLLVRKCE
jgi:hypothetical protein